MLNTAVLRSKTVAAIGVLFLFVLSLQVVYRNSDGRALLSKVTTPPAEKTSDDLLCSQLPYADEVAVILRTGATEIQDKLPVHFETTFRCYKDLIIFSDYAEVFQDVQVHDVLASIDPAVKAQESDFEIYRRLQQHGRAAIKPEELSGDASFEGSKSGKKENAGWKLDKWKFLPMMNETLRLHPDKKWYIFLETDSYMVWSNMLQWLQQLDPSQPLYFGNENQIGPDIYAHGGSVFVMSFPAVLKAAEAYAAEEDKWNTWTARHWAGDCVLGKLLKEAGVPLTWTWPMLQGGHPAKMNFGEAKAAKSLWCAPSLSYHHFSPGEMVQMWQFEQNWIHSRQQLAIGEGREPWQDDMQDVLHHSDVFLKYIYPNITTDWREWNNLSPDLIMAGRDDYNACFQLCEQSEDCVQFSTSPAGCSISTKAIMLGQRWADFRSYWVMSRVDKQIAEWNRCDGKDGWLVT